MDVGILELKTKVRFDKTSLAWNMIEIAFICFFI